MWSPTTITSIPSEIFLLILGRVPLEDLLRSASTSRHWHQWQQVSCHNRTVLSIYHELSIDNYSDEKSYFTMSHSLVRGFTIPYCNEINFDFNQYQSLQFQSGPVSSTIRFTKNNFTLVDAQWLTDKFPQIKTFYFAQKLIPNDWYKRKSQIALNSLIYLLHHWSSSLESVKLFIEDYSEKDTFNLFPAFWTQFNRLSALKRLMIEFPNAKSLHKELRLPIIDQLEQFFLHFNNDQISEITNILNQVELVDPNQLRHYAVMRYANKLMQTRYEQNANHQIVQLPNIIMVDELVSEADHRRDIINPTQLCPLTRTFPNLTILQVWLFNINLFPQLMQCLQSLQQLTFIELHSNQSQHPVEQSDKPIWSPVRSVKVLFLSFPFFHCHQDLDCLHLGHSFPEVQVVRFICLIFEENEHKCQHKHICRHLVQPLKKCAKLRKVYTIKWILDELKEEFENWPNKNVKWDKI